MSSEAVQAAIERLRRRDERLGGYAETAADWMTAGEGTEVLDQASVQQFLRWHLPRKFDQQRWDEVVAGAAALFDELGLEHYAAIARSAETQEILGAWRFNPDLAAKRYLAAQASSGVDAPDTDLLRWSDVMGMYELQARTEVGRALEVAILAGELTPGARGWKQRAAQICGQTLTAPRDDMFGQTALDLVLTERIETWNTTARSEQHRMWREGVARRLLAPVPPPAGFDSVVAAMRWLLERAADTIGLTQSHYLARAVVLEAVERFGWWDWEPPPHSEADVPQLGELRATASMLRLVRRQGRKLTATIRGRALLAEPVGLWNELASTLGGNDQFGQMVAELIGLRLLDGPAIDDELEQTLAPILVAQGWRAGAEPVTQRDVGYAIGIRLFWWRMLRLLDETWPRWENQQPTGDRTTALTPVGETTVHAYLRSRAIGPRRHPFS
jgi:hypothetical protein